MQLQQSWNEAPIMEAPMTGEVESVPPISSDKLMQIEVRVVDVLANYAVLGLLVGFTPGEVVILVKEAMSDERVVAVHWNAFSFEGQILCCTPQDQEYEVHISIDDTEGAGLRREPRFPVVIPAELMQPDGIPVGVTIRDISRYGMGIDTPLALEVGRPIGIASGPAFVFAVVRYCRPSSNGTFRAGVEMLHLFEPKRIETKPVRRSIFSGLLNRWFCRRSDPSANSKLIRVGE
jgi:PilZ domain